MDVVDTERFIARKEIKNFFLIFHGWGKSCGRNNISLMFVHCFFKN